MGDATAIWFWRVEGGRIDVIDYYETNGKPFSHYADVPAGRGYKCERHFLPHDARARSYQTGVTTLELARERLGGGVQIVPMMPIEQGVMAARWMLQQDVRLHAEKCAQGIEALRAYSYSFDEERRTFSSRPEHSWASHGADALRYLATIARAMIELLQPEISEPSVPCEPTLDELWELRDRQVANRDKRGCGDRRETTIPTAPDRSTGSRSPRLPTLTQIPKTIQRSTGPAPGFARPSSRSCATTPTQRTGGPTKSKREIADLRAPSSMVPEFLSSRSDRHFLA
jgi:hypothetical protein